MLRPSRPQDEATLQAGLAQLVAAELLYQRGRPPRPPYMLQARLDPGCGLCVVAQEHAAAGAPADCPGLGNTVPRACGDAAGAGGPALHGGRLHRAGGALLAAGGPTGQRPLGQCGSRQPLAPPGSSCSRPCQRRLSIPSKLVPAHRPRRGTADGQRAGSARGGARLHPGLRVVSAGGRDARACAGPVWAVAVLSSTGTVAHGARARGNAAAPGATHRRPRARGHRPLCPRVDVVAALARCLLPASTWRKASHATRQTNAVRRCSALAKIWVLPADPMPRWTLWLLGYPAQALARVHEALTLAHELSHPYSLAFARCWAAYVYQFRRDVPAVHEQAEAAVALSTAQGFPQWAALGTILRGWALALQGQGEEGIAQIRQGIAACRATGAALFVPYFCTLLADVCCPPGPHGRRPPGAGRGPHPGGAT